MKYVFTSIGCSGNKEISKHKDIHKYFLQVEFYLKTPSLEVVKPVLPFRELVHKYCQRHTKFMEFNKHTMNPLTVNNYRIRPIYTSGVFYCHTWSVKQKKIAIRCNILR